MGEFGRTLDLKCQRSAERLRAAGYRTGLMGKWHLSELPASPQGEERIRWLDHRTDLDAPFAQAESLPTRRGFDRFYGIVWGVVDHFDPFSLCDGETPVQTCRKTSTCRTRSRPSANSLQESAAADKPFFLYVCVHGSPLADPGAAEDIAKYDGKYDGGWDEVRRQRFRRQTEMGLFDKSSPLGDVITQRPVWPQLPKEDKHSSPTRWKFTPRWSIASITASDRSLTACGTPNCSTTRSFSSCRTTVHRRRFLSEAGYDRNSGTRDGRPALREAELQLAINRDKLGTEESYAGIGPGWASAANTPLRYWKMESYEGGCRTPLVVHWPAGLKQKAGSIVRDTGHVIDITPTCLELAGLDTTDPAGDDFNIDGVSLRPVIAAAAPLEERSLYFLHEQGRGVRRGKFKASKRGDQAWELFDIEADPGETQDMAKVFPEVLDSLVREFG